MPLSLFHRFWDSYALHSLVRFLRFTLPHDLLGHWAWLAPLAIGAVVGLRRSAWAFVYLYLVVNAAFMLSLYWAARYFTTAAPLLCLLTASGGVWMRRTHGERRLVGALRLRHVLLPCALLVALFQIVRTDRTAAPTYTPELEAARSQAAFLRARLAPGEAVMAEITSYWAYFTDRPAVYPVVADEARFREVVRRLRVRYAALPTSRLAEFAARYPARRLPAALVRHHEDAAHDVTVFEVRADD